MAIDNRQRVFDFLMRRLREGAHHFHPFAGHSIRSVDDAQRRFATLHQRQRAAHVFRRRKLRRQDVYKRQHLNNKAIILWLIQALESTDDVVTADVIRKTLEIVVGYTMDDI